MIAVLSIFRFYYSLKMAFTRPKKRLILFKYNSENYRPFPLSFPKITVKPVLLWNTDILLPLLMVLGCCLRKIPTKKPLGDSPKGHDCKPSATWQSWPYGFRPMVLRRRLSVTLPFRASMHCYSIINPLLLSSEMSNL